MANNANNHLSTSLEWTKYTSPDDLPIGEIVFRSKGDRAKPNEGEEYEYKFGKTRPTRDRTLAIVEGQFDYMYDFWLKDAEWSLISFILNEDE